ncbi:hypothetical protein LCGC14_1912030 [marine sediment metagenome]|uniref:7-carboxy-7-deazaguanine synthase n=1 Tax=marine sediment metagenome TaxID=412755 RepID=A0A0F9GGH9_9ZZZZ
MTDSKAPKTYMINEIFYSLQGEGMRAGTANVFVRFSGCNMRCRKEAADDSPGGFDCDTEFVSGRRMTLEEIHTSKAEFDRANFEQEVRMGSHAAENTTEPQEEREGLIRHRGKVWSLVDAGVAHLWTRLDSVVSQLVMGSGGYASATETLYQMFDRILGTSKYINTTTRRREIVYRLYRKYYQGKSE